MECLACGSSANMSKEHIFPQWLQELLNARRVELGLFRPVPDGSRTVVRQPFPLQSFTLKRICEGCNNGWMSRLETKTKPVLAPLLDGSRTLESLRRDEQELIARWAGKTAVIESHSIGAQNPVDANILRYMRTNEDGPPGRFAVAAASFQFVAIGHLQAGIIRELLNGATVAGNVVLLLFPNVAFIVAFPTTLPELTYEVRCDRSRLFPLWPYPPSWRDMTVDETPVAREDNVEAQVWDLAHRIEIFQATN